MPTSPATEPSLFVLLSDVTPNRATVEFIGSEEEANDVGIYCDDYTACTLAPVRDGIEPEVGERVWIDRSGERVLRVSGRAN